jgi:hypothetical protein
MLMLLTRTLKSLSIEIGGLNGNDKQIKEKVPVFNLFQTKVWKVLQTKV